MKKTKIITTMALVAAMGLLFACGGEEATTQEAAGPTYELLTEDGSSVIFTNNEVTSGAPAQFQLFDSTLLKIMNGETFTNNNGGSDYHLQYVRFKLAIFGVTLKDGTVIDKVVCEKNEAPLSGDPAEDLRLLFGNYVVNGVSMSDPINGIPWQDLIEVQGAPLIADRALPCTGGGKNFVVNLFKDNGISDDEFTLYFDFKGERLFSGKLVVTEAGEDPSTDGVILYFN